MNKYFTLALIIYFSPAFSQALLKDANTANAGTHPRSVVNANGTIYFVGNTLDNADGVLYKTDGTESGTVLVVEPDTATGSSRGPYLPLTYNFQNSSYGNQLLFPIGNKVVFSAYGINPNLGRELWISDGTAAGTAMLKDIYPGISGSFPNSFMGVGSNVFFWANDNVHGMELWATDGTSAGTSMILETYPGISSHFIDMSKTRILGNKLIFTYYNNLSGSELWVSDGTLAGTVMLKDIFSGSGSSNPDNLTVLGNKLYFTANDNVNGTELWVTDGTAVGTQLAIDLTPAQIGTNPANLTTFNGQLIFTANGYENGIYKKRLWISDGSLTGTSSLKTMAGYEINVQDYTQVGSKLFFTDSDDMTGQELWVTEGTPSTTKLVKDINLSSGGSVDYTFPYFKRQFFDVNGKLIFLANSGPEGFELWVSDGTATGTKLIKDFVTGTISADYSNFKVLGNDLYFIVNDDSGSYDCWKTDGTLAGTVKVHETYPAAEVQNLFPLETIGNTLYMAGFGKNVGYELYKTDGVSFNLVKDVSTSSNSIISEVNLQRRVSMGDQLIYTYDDGLRGKELWKTNGTDSGTVRITDVITYPTLTYDYYNQTYANYSEFGNLTQLNGYAYFIQGGRTIMRTDGVSTEVWQTYNGNERIHNLIKNGSHLYWLHGTKLYVYDGNSIKLVKQLSTYYTIIDEVPLFTLGASAFFYYGDISTGIELWKTDGTAAGTELLKDINPGDSHSITYAENKFPNIGNKVYFVAYSRITGAELWVTDGTEAGTQLTKDIFPGPNSNYPENLTKINDSQLLFSAQEDSTGIDLWVSDGTAAGTQKIIELGTTSGQNSRINGIGVLADNSFISYYSGGINKLVKRNSTTGNITELASNFTARSFQPFEGQLYFAGQIDNAGADSGNELWKTDGTFAGTVMVKDINVGSGSSNPQNFIVHNNDLYFTADDGVHGNEVYILRSCFEVENVTVTTTKTGIEIIDASNSIIGETANNIASTGKISYNAGKYVLLKAGFNTESGAVFTAQIGGCGNEVLPPAAAVTNAPAASKMITAVSPKTAQYIQDLWETPTIEQFLVKSEDKSLPEIWDRYQRQVQPLQSDVSRFHRELEEINQSLTTSKETTTAQTIATLHQTKEATEMSLFDVQQDLQRNQSFIRPIRNEAGVKTHYEFVIITNGKEYKSRISLPE